MHCQICGMELQEGNPGNVYGTESGMNHLSNHHLFPKRFKNYFSVQEIQEIFRIENQKSQTTLCYECHEEILHNFVLNESMISNLSILAMGKTKKEKIELFHEIFKKGIEEQLKTKATGT